MKRGLAAAAVARGNPQGATGEGRLALLYRLQNPGGEQNTVTQERRLGIQTQTEKQSVFQTSRRSG